MSALSPGKSNKRDPTVLNYCYSSPSYERGREGGCIAYFHHLSQNDRGRWKGRKEERDAANNDRGGMSHWRPFHQIHSKVLLRADLVGLTSLFNESGDLQDYAIF